MRRLLVVLLAAAAVLLFMLAAGEGSSPLRDTEGPPARDGTPPAATGPASSVPAAVPAGGTLEEGTRRQVQRGDGVLTVRAFAPDGDPVPGVEIVARFDVLLEGVHEREVRLPLGPTDGNGTVVREEFAGDLRRHGDDLRGVEVSARLLDRPGPPVPVDLQAWSEEPVRVPVPGHGSFALTVLDPLGDPLDPRYLHEGHRVHPWTHDPTPERLTAPESYPPPGSVRVPLGPGGRVRRERVPLCGAVQAWPPVLPRGGPWIFPGPATAGEAVGGELRLDPGAAVVLGRGLDEDGSVLARARLRLRGEGVWDEGRTDDEGRFRFRLYPMGLADLRPRTVRLTVLDDRGHVRRGTRLRRERPFAAGANDLGDVVLAPCPVLVSGTVRRSDDVGLERIPLRLEGSVDGASWFSVGGRAERWGGAGFRFRGLPDATRLRLRVLRGAWRPLDPLSVEPGSNDVEIVLGVGGSLTATVFTDRRLAAGEVVCRLKDGSGSRRPMRLQRTGPERVRWRAEGLDPGRYRLVVRCARFGQEPLVAIDDLLVPDGGECTDPRLQEIDLRGRVTAFTVRAVDAAGERVRDGRGLVLTPPTVPGSLARLGDLGHGVVEVAAPRPLDVVVAVPGHRRAVLEDVADDVVVTLEPAPTVGLQLLADLRGLPDGVELAVIARPLDGRAVGRDAAARASGAGQHSVPLDRAGHGRLCLASPCRLMLVLRDGGAATNCAVQPEEASPADLRDGRLLHLNVTGEDLREAVERLATRRSGR